MANPQYILDDLKKRFAASPEYTRLYLDEDPELAPVFAGLHEQLNELLGHLNARGAGGYYLADWSRSLITLTTEVGTIRRALRRIGIEFEMSKDYEDALDQAKTFLAPSHGSTIPEDYKPLDIEIYDSIFSKTGATARLPSAGRVYTKVMIGSGSYANVHRYFDEDYKVNFAIKSAKKGLDPKELERFQQEYKILNELNFPYVLQVFSYNEAEASYTMEFCESTLDDYIKVAHAQGMSQPKRKRIAPAVPLRDELPALEEGLSPRREQAEYSGQEV